MGLFIDSSDEKALRHALSSISELVGMVYTGQISLADLHEVLDDRRASLQSLYDAVSSKSSRSARRIMNDSFSIARIWAERNAQPLMAEVLDSLDRPY